MTKWTPAAVLICIAAGVAFWLSRPQNHSWRDAKFSPNHAPLALVSTSSPVRSASNPAEQPRRNNQYVASTNLPAPSNETTLPPNASVAAGPSQSSTVASESDLSPTMAMENLRIAIRNYGQRMGGNPVGNNAEITKALNGGNSNQVTFLSPEKGLRLNANGESVDPWGTPYFFHQLSASQMEIRSAGPDKKMWTADDLVTQ